MCHATVRLVGRTWETPPDFPERRVPGFMRDELNWIKFDVLPWFRGERGLTGKELEELKNENLEKLSGSRQAPPPDTYIIFDLTLVRTDRRRLLWGSEFQNSFRFIPTSFAGCWRFAEKYHDSTVLAASSARRIDSETTLQGWIFFRFLLHAQQRNQIIIISSCRPALAVADGCNSVALLVHFLSRTERDMQTTPPPPTIWH